MKVVIDIPDEWKTRIEYNRRPNTIECGELVESIWNGKILPKGHGRIADVDDAIKCIKDVEGDDAIWAISLIEWACAKRTIIEADKEAEDI